MTYNSRLYLTRGMGIIPFSPPPKFSTEAQVSMNASAGYSTPYGSTPGFMAAAFMRVPPSALPFPSPDAGTAACAAGLPLQGSLLPLHPTFSSCPFPPFCRSGFTQA